MATPIHISGPESIRFYRNNPQATDYNLWIIYDGTTYTLNLVENTNYRSAYIPLKHLKKAICMGLFGRSENKKFNEEISNLLSVSASVYKSNTDNKIIQLNITFAIKSFAEKFEKHEFILREQEISPFDSLRVDFEKKIDEKFTETINKVGTKVYTRGSSNLFFSVANPFGVASGSPPSLYKFENCLTLDTQRNPNITFHLLLLFSTFIEKNADHIEDLYTKFSITRANKKNPENLKAKIIKEYSNYLIQNDTRYKQLVDEGKFPAEKNRELYINSLDAVPHFLSFLSQKIKINSIIFDVSNIPRNGRGDFIASNNPYIFNFTLNVDFSDMRNYSKKYDIVTDKQKSQKELELLQSQSVLSSPYIDIQTTFKDINEYIKPLMENNISIVAEYGLDKGNIYNTGSGSYQIYSNPFKFILLEIYN